MLTLPFQILTQLCLNENEADEGTESYNLSMEENIVRVFNADHA